MCRLTCASWAPNLIGRKVRKQEGEKVNGRFGVFDGTELVGGVEFFDDESADRYRRDLLQEELPEHMRTALYDPHDLEVREIPEEYDDFRRLISGLKAIREEGEKSQDAAA